MRLESSRLLKQIRSSIHLSSAISCDSLKDNGTGIEADRLQGLGLLWVDERAHHAGGFF